MDPANPGATLADSDLIDRIRDGDVQAYGRLVTRYQRSILAAVLPVLRDTGAAHAEVMEEAQFNELMKE